MVTGKKRLTAVATAAGIGAWLTFGIFIIHWNNDPPHGVLEPAPSPGPAPQETR